MTPERLLAHYERIADAPDAVARLRRFVLDLAVRGKLVPQDAGDEPASELLKRIATEKARLAKTGEIKRDKPSFVTSDPVFDFDIAAGWTAAYLGDLSVCLDYRRVPINSTERESRIEGKAPEDLFPYYGATQQQGWIDDYLFDGEFVLLGEDGAPFHEPLRTKAYIITGKSWVNNHAHVFQGILISPRFLVHYLNVFDYAGRVVGATRAKLNQAQALVIPVALPPLAEQHRIVAKVDELMALCDRLEAARAEREATRDRLAAASLARLNAPDPDTFADDASFALHALPALTTRPDQIKQLRQTILNLAVRGELVRQNPKDEPASNLLIRLSKLRSISESTGRGRSSTGKARSDFDGVQDFTIPSTWAWARLVEIGKTQTGTSPSSNNPDLFGNFIPFIKPSDLDGPHIHYDGPGLSEIGVNHSRLAPPNSVLMVCIGATLGKVNTTTRSICFNQQINALTPFIDEHSAFIALALKATGFQALAWSKAGTGTLPIISKGKWEQLPIPLPPLAEQHRIVARVDELMALCDRLERGLATAANIRRHLLDALLAEALAPVETELAAAE